MLVRFVVSNYLSFGEEVEFNTFTGSPRRFKDHIYQFDGIELLKIAAIYGPNGAGKSNLIRALLLLRTLILDDTPVNKYRISPFRLTKGMDKQPTHLEIEMIIAGVLYNYGIEIYAGEVLEEWLYFTGPRRNELIFSRKTLKGTTKILMGESFSQSAEDQLRIRLYEQELLHDNQLLLSLLSTSKKVFPEIQKIKNWFENSLSIIDSGSRATFLSGNFALSRPFQEFANELLKTLHTGIFQLELETIDIDRYFGEDNREESAQVKLRLEKNPEEIEYISEDHTHLWAVALMEDEKVVVKRLVAKHKNANGELVLFELDEESDGTLRILDFAPALFSIIHSPSTVIIDEIDQSIHPYLLKQLIGKFTRNNKTKGQLIFTTHESNLLDQNIFRQDEIWFTEKKSTGETALYPLSDFSIRFDLDIQKGYLQGRFGAIPFLGNLQDLNWDIYAEEEQGV